MIIKVNFPNYQTYVWGINHSKKPREKPFRKAIHYNKEKFQI